MYQLIDKESAVYSLEKEVILEREGRLLKVFCEDKGLLRFIKRSLTYTYRRVLRGKELYDKGRQMDFERRECFVDMPGGIVTGAGFTMKLWRLLKEKGIQPKLLMGSDWKFPPDFSVLDDYEFRYKQLDCLETLFKFPEGRICCPTGFGKTFLIGVLCKLFPNKTFNISTYSIDALMTIYERLQDLGVESGIYCSRKKTGEYRVMCVSGRSIPSVRHKMDFLILDEVHEFATFRSIQNLMNLDAKRVYGFSANLPGDRTDGVDFELEGIVGPLIFHVKYQESVKGGNVSPVDVLWCRVGGKEVKVGDNQPVEFLRFNVWRNDVRNKRIAEVARSFPNQQVLITTAVLEHALQIKRFLPEFELCFGGSDRNAKLIRRMQAIYPELQNVKNISNSERDRIRDLFSQGKLKKVIATTVWDRAVDFKGLEVLIRADALAAKVGSVQKPGRLSRIAFGKKRGLLVDFSDDFSETLRNKARIRRRTYRSLGWKEVSWSDAHAPGFFGV